MLTRDNNQGGFTLIELLITVMLIGILSMTLSPFFKLFMTAKTQSYIESQRFINLKISKAFLENAQQNTALGTLPVPYENLGSKITKGVVDPTNSNLVGLLMQQGISPTELNDDGYAAARVRVFQSVVGLTTSMPLYFKSGALVTLTYDFGVIYMTDCARATTACNPATSGALPGSSVALTSSNFTTWVPSGTDFAPVAVSTLPLQKLMLKSTGEKLDKLRNALVVYFKTKVLTAAANDTSNWYPAPNGTGAPVLSGADPAVNQGCRDGWYNLNAGNVNVLDQVGLSATEFGTTDWGGVIQYCRKYDPTGALGATAAPHYGAIRFNKDISKGLAPDTVTLTNNVVMSF